MRVRKNVVPAFAAIAFLAGCRSLEVREVTAREFRVLRVVDGDTFVVPYDGEKTSVRVAGIDAPEPRKPGGPEATEALRALVGGEVVRLVFAGWRKGKGSVGVGKKRDNFGRLWCHVYLGDLDVGRELVRTGNAVKR